MIWSPASTVGHTMDCGIKLMIVIIALIPVGFTTMEQITILVHKIMAA